MIDLKLDPPDDQERERGQKQPDPDFTHGSERENPVDRRIKPVIEQRNHRQDEKSVYDVDLLRQKTEAEEVQVHMLALDGPFAAATLVPERPENHREGEDDPDAREDTDPFPTRQVAQKAEPGGRDVHHFSAAHPEYDRSDKHQHARQTKGVPWSPIRIAEQNRTEPDRKGRAEIDGKIEPAKNAREQVLVRFAELVADVCRDARLDPARSEERRVGKECRAR